ncbi:CMRF35-like molecule 7 [Larus michahellis]|uniref:CMRF35-like molecule 7 n=1 Tax=Larus michahellis TaxID=119627 RepID=UPI003D9AE04C
MGERFLVWTWILLPGCWALQGPKEVSGFPGGSVEVPCKYKPELADANKYWCRGSSWFSCSILVQTTTPRNEVLWDRVSLRDDPVHHMFVVTMENLTVEDSDQYWCGIQVTWYDPMFPVMVSVLPVPRSTQYDLHTTQREEATSAPTFPWTPLELENTVSMPEYRSLQTRTLNLLVLFLTSAAVLVLVLVLGVIICRRIRRASLEKSKAAQAMERRRAKDLQVPSSWKRAAASNNIYMNRERELSLPEDDYENRPAKWQDFEKEDEVSVSRAPNLQPIYMNTR